MEDGSYPGPGLCADEAHGEDVGEDRPRRRSRPFAWSCSTTRTCRWAVPGRSIKGTAALTEFRVDAAPADAPSEGDPGQVRPGDGRPQSAREALDPIFDDKSGKKRVTGPIGFAIDGKDETAWGTDAGPGRRNQPRKAVFTAEKPIAFPRGTILTFHLTQNHGGWNSDDNQSHNIGRFRLSITSAPDAVADPVPAAVREILAIPRSQAVPRPGRRRLQLLADDRAAWKDANARIEAHWHQHPEGASQLVLWERQQRRPTQVLQRGDFLKPIKPVEPGVPAFLNPMPAGQPADRLTFARWLVNRQSPTTARSIVNRIWQADFGTGIVATSEDLGLQCEPPSHPELLDWLAVELMERGWSLKHLHRLIVNSSTYRQSSRATPALLARDPYNRLLARGPRFRVDAEIVRDIALAASGLLEPEDRRPQRLPAGAGLPVPAADQLWPESLARGGRTRSLSTRALYLPIPLGAVPDAPVVRRTQRRLRLRPPLPIQYAAPGADNAQ